MEKPPAATLEEKSSSPDTSRNDLPLGQVSWLESKLKPKTIHHRYPFKGKPLLWMTCAFGSLGDALFGYDQGSYSLAYPSISNGSAQIITFLLPQVSWQVC